MLITPLFLRYADIHLLTTRRDATGCEAHRRHFGLKEAHCVNSKTTAVVIKLSCLRVLSGNFHYIRSKRGMYSICYIYAVYVVSNYACTRRHMPLRPALTRVLVKLTKHIIIVPFLKQT